MAILSKMTGSEHLINSVVAFGFAAFIFFKREDFFVKGPGAALTKFIYGKLGIHADSTKGSPMGIFVIYFLAAAALLAGGVELYRFLLSFKVL